jgi:4-amino-4-deoxy-L-arabinose transferase-like glycosyltransferase
LNERLAGQISWLLPLALLGLVAAAWQTPWTFPLSQQHQALLLWAAWLITQGIAFSMAQGLFHRYYLVMLAPAIAALVGAGLVALWRDYQSSGQRGWLLPVALLATAAAEAHTLAEYPAWSRWLTPLIVALCLAATTALLALRLARCPDRRKWGGAAATGAFLALVIGPGTWSVTPVLAKGDGLLPAAGPEVLTQLNVPALRHADVDAERRLVGFLQANWQGEKYLLATSNAQLAAPLILQTGQPVMAMGGFTGSDPILTPSKLTELTANNAVRYFLILKFANQSLQGTPGWLESSVQVATWIRQKCNAVEAALWQSPDTATFARLSHLTELYDCAPWAAQRRQPAPQPGTPR